MCRQKPNGMQWMIKKILESTKNYVFRRMLPHAKDTWSWARILEHLVEAEKSTFRGELSFQRSKWTQGPQKLKFFVLIVKNILCSQLRPNICILYIETIRRPLLEVLHSHFQPNCHFKMFKNTGSFGRQRVTPMSLAIGQIFFHELVLLVSFYEDDISHLQCI